MLSSQIILSRKWGAFGLEQDSYLRPGGLCTGSNRRRLTFQQLSPSPSGRNRTIIADEQEST